MSVRLSVRPSVKRVNCDKNKETSAHIFVPYRRSFILVFRHEERLAGMPPCTWNFGPNWPYSYKNADFQSTFARSVSTVIRSEKYWITDSTSTMRFPMSLTWTAYVACKPPKGAQKRQNSCFPSKSALFAKYVYYKVFFCVRTASDSVVRHSLTYLSVKNGW